MPIPDSDRLRDIAAALRPHLKPTPMTHDPALGIALKWENRQHGGSFKYRGALWKVLALRAAGECLDMVGVSTGNHGLALSHLARRFGFRCVLFVPRTTSEYKLDTCRELGTSVHRIDGDFLAAEAAARRYAASQGMHFVSPGCDWDIADGTATLALDLLEQAPDASAWLLPAGGGTLVSSLGASLKALSPGIRVFGVQAAASPYLHSLYHHGPDAPVREEDTEAEGLAGPLETEAVAKTLLREACDGILLVSEADIARAVRAASRLYGELVEPTGAVALAAVLAGRVADHGGPVGVFITGGNVHPDAREAFEAARPERSATLALAGAA